MSRNEEEYPDRLENGHRRKILIIIDVFFLSIPFCNKPDLKGLNYSARSYFSLVDPLTPNKFNIDRLVHKFPYLIKVHRLHLYFHSFLPTSRILVIYSSS